MATTTATRRWQASPADPGHSAIDDGLGEMVAETYPTVDGWWRWVVWGPVWKPGREVAGRARTAAAAKRAAVEALEGLDGGGRR